MSHQLQVIRIAADTVVASVIHLLLARNVAVKMGEGYEVNGHRLSIQGHSAIASASTFPTVTTLPFPAAGFVDDMNSVHDPAYDRLPTSHIN